MEELRRKAIDTWIKYGEVIIEAFSFQKDSLIESSPLENILATADEKRIKEFIAYVEEQIKELKKAKYIGE